MKLIYEIKENLIGKTINQILTTELNISTRLLNKLIKNEKVSANQMKCDTRNLVHLGTVLEINFDIIEDNSNIINTKKNLNIIY